MTDAAGYLEPEEDGRYTVMAQWEELDRFDLTTINEPLDRVDVHCTDAHWLRADHLEADTLYGWKLSVHRSQFNDSRFRRVNLRDLRSVNPVRMERIHVDEDIILYDADFPYANLSDGFVGGIVRLRGEKTGRVDLRGTGAGGVQTLFDDLDDHHVIVDEDTYIHLVPDELSQDLGYRSLSDEAAQLITLAEEYGAPFTADDLVKEYKSAARARDYLPSLAARNFVDRDDDTYTLSRRGEHAARFLSR